MECTFEVPLFVVDGDDDGEFMIGLSEGGYKEQKHDDVKNNLYCQIVEQIKIISKDILLTLLYM